MKNNSEGLRGPRACPLSFVGGFFIHTGRAWGRLTARLGNIAMSTEPTAPATNADESIKEQEIFQARLKKAEALREMGVNPYGNGFACDATAAEVEAALGAFAAYLLVRYQRKKDAENTEK